MKEWTIKRDGHILGYFNATELKLVDNVLYAYHNTKKMGVIASGSGLTWEISE